MKTNKELIHNQHYFTHSDVLNLIAIGLMLAAGISYVSGVGIFSYLLLALGLPLGVILFIFDSVTRAGERELDEYIARLSFALGKAVEDDRHYEKKKHPRLGRQEISGYEYEEGLMLRIDKSGTLRSSRYTATALYPLREGLCVCSRSFSLTEDACTETVEELPYAALQPLRIEPLARTLTFGKRSFTCKGSRLVIAEKEGRAFSLPLQDDLQIEDYIAAINKLIRAAQE